MKIIKSYKDLKVWQKSMLLVTEVYKMVRKLPKEETYALSDQMRRAAVSIPSNIAEGYSRNTDRELLQFLYIARGSKSELDTQIMIGANLEYFSEEDIRTCVALSEETGKLLNSFITKVKENAANS